MRWIDLAPRAELGLMTVLRLGIDFVLAGQYNKYISVFLMGCIKNLAERPVIYLQLGDDLSAG
jgi:hypothetical protein